MSTRHEENKFAELLNIASYSVSLLPEAMEVIDAYFFAGCKESRKQASEKAKTLYNKYNGEKYKNLKQASEKAKTLYNKNHSFKKYKNPFKHTIAKCKICKISGL